VNASPLLVDGVFLLVCALLFVLPFVPVLREWRRPTDAAALPVSRDYASDIDHFSNRLRADALARLGLGPPTGHVDFDFLPARPQPKDFGHGRRLIATADVHSFAPLQCTAPLYVQGGLRAPADSTFIAIHAAGDIELGARCRISDWAHADGRLRVGPGSAAIRRISAGVAIELGNESWFDRLNAPEIRFGLHDGAAGAPVIDDMVQVPSALDQVPGAVRQTPTQVLVRGDCALPAGRRYEGSLVVTGFLTIGAGTTVVGDIKARLGASIGPRAAVHGALTCENRVYVLPDASAWGPLVCESDMLIGSRAVIGLPDAPTTVSARNIIVEEACVVHGEVWAHELGMVKSV
jgi:hypothetical protein